MAESNRRMKTRTFLAILCVTLLASCYNDKCVNVFVIEPLHNGIEHKIYLDSSDKVRNDSIIAIFNSTPDKKGLVVMLKKKQAVERLMYNNNNVTGSAFAYRSNGSIFMYQSFDFEDHLRYKRKYKNDSIYTSEGEILGQSMWENKIIPVSDSIVVYIAYAIPPHCTSYLNIKDFLQNKASVNCDDYIKMSGMGGIAVVKNKYSIPGDYTRCIYAKLIDSLSHKTEYDTIIGHFTLK